MLGPSEPFFRDLLFSARIFLLSHFWYMLYEEYYINNFACCLFLILA